GSDSNRAAMRGVGAINDDHNSALWTLLDGLAGNDNRAMYPLGLQGNTGEHAGLEKVLRIVQADTRGKLAAERIGRWVELSDLASKNTPGQTVERRARHLAEDYFAADLFRYGNSHPNLADSLDGKERLTGSGKRTGIHHARGNIAIHRGRQDGIGATR